MRKEPKKGIHFTPYMAKFQKSGKTILRHPQQKYNSFLIFQLGLLVLQIKQMQKRYKNIIFPRFTPFGTKMQKSTRHLSNYFLQAFRYFLNFGDSSIRFGDIGLQKSSIYHRPQSRRGQKLKFSYFSGPNSRFGDFFDIKLFYLFKQIAKKF